MLYCIINKLAFKINSCSKKKGFKVIIFTQRAVGWIFHSLYIFHIYSCDCLKCYIQHELPSVIVLFFYVPMFIHLCADDLGGQKMSDLLKLELQQL